MTFNYFSKFCLMTVGIVFTISSCTTQKKVEWVSSTPEQSWEVQNTLKTGKPHVEADFKIDTRQVTLQTIEGFGACFNELGWTSLNSLNPADLNTVLNELFSPGVGANFNICRMPLGANDFSRDWYSYCETEGDFEMESFSIKNDLETLVPFITVAKKYNPDLKIWASPWCPPSWMKYNKHYACAVPWAGLDEKFTNHLLPENQGKEGTDMFIQEDAYFKAYALYFKKFIEAYRGQGIDISMVMPQNEFNSCQIFPSCTWTAKGLTKFIGEFLGPEMQEIGVDLFFGTMERPAVAIIDTVLTDPKAGKYVKGVGFQWAGKDALPGVQEKYAPEMKLYQTEQECGNGKNDWEHCVHLWDLMKHYLNNGVNSYLYWNISLDKGGYSRWGWQQNSLVTVDVENKTYHFNYEYYLLKHLSGFVQSGAQKLVSGKDILTFLNPDGSVVIMLYNENTTLKEYKFNLDETGWVANLKPLSFNTFLVKQN
jgi:glucosylceramidase